MKALFIGRFQPFHLGHLQIVKRIIKEQREIIIAIGSSQESNTLLNPFTAQERKQMITAVLEAENIQKKQYSLPFVPDLGDHQHWVKHLIQITGKIDVVYTGSKLTKMLFKKEGYTVIDIPRIQDISATIIREKIAQGKSLIGLVHPEVRNILQQIHARKRLLLIR